MNNEQEVNGACIPENLSLKDAVRALIRANPNRRFIISERNGPLSGASVVISEDGKVTLIASCDLSKLVVSPEHKEQVLAGLLANSNTMVKIKHPLPGQEPMGLDAFLESFRTPEN